MSQTKGRGRKKALITGFGSVMLFVLAFTVLFFFNFRTIEVQGPSMEPTLKTGRRLLVSSAYWLIGPIKKGDIVVVHLKDKDDIVIKRVLGLGGDKIDPNNWPDQHSLTEGDYTVPQGQVFIVGDNRLQSEDSRTFGPVTRGEVIGKVVIW